MTGRKRGATIHAEQLRHSWRLSGPVRVVHPAIKAAGCPWQWDERRSAYLLSARSVDDVLARLELAGHHVEIVGGGLW